MTKQFTIIVTKTYEISSDPSYIPFNNSEIPSFAIYRENLPCAIM